MCLIDYFYCMGVFMKGFLYLAIDDDDIGLPQYCCDSLKDLSKFCKRDVRTISNYISLKRHDLENKCFYIRVKLISDEEEEAPEKPVNKYIEHGYDNRADYLKSLAEEYDISYGVVCAIAKEYGPNEDFDGLVATLQDMSKNI